MPEQSLCGCVLIGVVLATTHYLAPAVDACHWTTIVVRNGTWCCGDVKDQADVAQADVNVPPGVVPPAPTVQPQPVTQPPDGPTDPPQPAVGNCVCGTHVTRLV